jgi:hypothetical protein
VGCQLKVSTDSSDEAIRLDSLDNGLKQNDNSWLGWASSSSNLQDFIISSFEERSSWIYHQGSSMPLSVMRKSVNIFDFPIEPKHSAALFNSFV